MIVDEKVSGILALLTKSSTAEEDFDTKFCDSFNECDAYGVKKYNEDNPKELPNEIKEVPPDQVCEKLTKPTVTRRIQSKN